MSRIIGMKRFLVRYVPLWGSSVGLVDNGESRSFIIWQTCQVCEAGMYLLPCARSRTHRTGCKFAFLGKRDYDKGLTGSCQAQPSYTSDGTPV